jgi:hypothetical protein
MLIIKKIFNGVQCGQGVFEGDVPTKTESKQKV